MLSELECTNKDVGILKLLGKLCFSIVMFHLSLVICPGGWGGGARSSNDGDQLYNYNEPK